MDLVLNKLQWFLWHNTKPNQIQSCFIFFFLGVFSPFALADGRSLEIE